MTHTIKETITPQRARLLEETEAIVADIHEYVQRALEEGVMVGAILNGLADSMARFAVVCSMPREDMCTHVGKLYDVHAKDKAKRSAKH